MKISSIRIKGYKQFKDIYLDFTHPETGKPLDKICFIGRNGTGKSTLLDFLNSLLPILSNHSNVIGSRFLIKFEVGGKEYYGYSEHSNSVFFFHLNVEKIPNWFKELENKDLHMLYSSTGLLDATRPEFYMVRNDEELNGIANSLTFKDNSKDLLIYSPSESQHNTYLAISDVPNTNLNNALTLFNIFPFYHRVSDNNVSGFWQLLIYLIKNRENEREAFENREENLGKTKKQLIDEFEKVNPKILTKLADLWNKILEKAGLEFDVENASNPIQLTDNLKAYIRHKETKERIAYSELSTGIRNFIFRVGHIYSLYFNREIEKGFLLLDEPENSLFPDFLFDLVDVYQELLVDKNGENNTQFFVSTHSPIIAAQFEPYERVVLEWNDEGYVEAHKGKAPVGDDPNDILTQDFQLKNLMGKKGQEKWNEYLQLKKQLRRMEDGSEKEQLVSKIAQLGSEYNFL